MSHEEGALRVYYIPQIPMPAFEVDVPDLKTGALVLDALCDFSAFEYKHNVKPDYSDVGGIIRWESDGMDAFDSSEVDPEEYEEWLS